MVKSGQVRYWAPSAAFENERETRFESRNLVVVLQVVNDAVVVYKFLEAKEGVHRVADVAFFEALTDVYF